MTARQEVTSRAHTRRLALSAASLVVLAVAGELLNVLNRDSWRMLTDTFGVGSICALAYGSLGTLILSRRPGNPVGRLFLGLAWITVLNEVAGEYALYSYSTLHAALPAAGALAWFSGWSFFLAWPVGLTLIFLYFPDGMPAGRRWRVVFALAVAGCALLLLASLGASGPVQPSNRVDVDPLSVNNVTGFLSPDLASSIGTAGWFTSGAALILAVVAAVLRLRGATGERREQLRWMAYFAAPVAPAFAAHFVTLAIFNAPDHDYAFPVYFLVFLLGVPVATGIAVLRYRLYDLDLVISRALVYGSLAAGITAVYVGIAVGIGDLVGSGGKPNLALSIVATAIVAVGFQPARERLQRMVNRLVYGRRATPYQVLSEFSSHVAGSMATDDVLPRMAQVLQEGTGAEVARVWLRSGDELAAAAAWPPDRLDAEPIAVIDGTLPVRAGASQRSVEVRHQGELLGALTVETRRGERLTPVEDRLLSDLAHQAGLLLKNVRLTADLQRRLEDLRASRQRLVSAQDAERRRLERNLHDGAQQHLVALKVKLGLAEMLAARDPEKAAATIEQVKRDTDEALETLRDLARGIYPPLLAEKGLLVALESQARKATLPVSVTANGLARYSQEVEATVYFCVLEALQNVQKYAHATSVSVSLAQLDGHVTFDVTDDGAGIDLSTVRRGAGLQNMEDRLDAIGGVLSLESAPAAGTSVRASIPVS